jgi:CubicO group peptidase (beta-lactamase class C family)
MTRFTALLACALALPSASMAQDAQATASAKVDALLARTVRAGGPGAAVMVISDGRVVHQKGYGLADVENRIPITPRTTFDLASVSKQFTAMAIMMLAERGKLALSDPISGFFPELPAYASRVTIRHLLTHTSGLPHYTELHRNRPAGVPEEPSSRDVVTMLATVPQPLFTAGDRFEYNNSGYVLLAQIVEKVSGMAFPAFMKANVFEPLGMDRTLVSDRIVAGSPDRAVSYDASWRFGWSYRNHDYTPLNRIYGDGNVNTSLEDMARWDRALSMHTLVKPATLAQAYEPTTLNDATRSNYGFGWRLSTWDSRPVLHHGGAWVGFRTYIVRIPSERLTVIVLSNVVTFKVAEVARTIADYYLADGPGRPASRQAVP